MQRSDFNYHLPSELIAQRPLQERAASRLLCLQQGQWQDGQFTDLIEQLQPADLLVFNDTRVMNARLYGHKPTGGKVEILIERLLDKHHAVAHVKASKRPKAGSKILLQNELELCVEEPQGDLLRLSTQADFNCIMQQQGHVPLPPYIERSDDSADLERYQTVYARSAGAVAAPTAGLHFDADMLQKIQSKGINTAFVTLHVGAGTFQPVRVDDLDQHPMHSEWLNVEQDVCDAVAATRERGGRVVAIGTTAVRCLETAAAQGKLQPYSGETRLFIRPGYRFRVVDALLTNFHLPESPLIMLVSAFAGYENVMRAYQHAVQQRYRFFSYGDAMWMSR
ncbi:MAG: tRNA preQ1(34) S-adenosylmethionine ribosyltransferase-isomerase QueA [gamma proteobacterium symbiont of Bathyaustriella thionipta]|nr:tRNA preQ1(34) S-adenosylmethionine ribosyltransferase-isomerase QueA [gamma proteobacterium symbiont of Bathyaustriella thionipta]